jgi:hypothetical protein
MPATIYPLAVGANKAPVSAAGARARWNIEVFPFAADAVGSYLIGAPLPVGARVLEVGLNTSVTLGGTATVAIGISGATGKYRAAATLTATDQWVSHALNAAVGVPLTAEEQLLLTVAAAPLPASGRLLIRVLYVLD